MKPTVEREETSNRTLLQAPTRHIPVVASWPHIQHSRLINVILYNLCKCFYFKPFQLFTHHHWLSCKLAPVLYFPWVVQMDYIGFAKWMLIYIQFCKSVLPECWDYIRTHSYRVFILLWHNSRMEYVPSLNPKYAHLTLFYVHLKYPCSHSPLCSTNGCV